MLELWVIFDEPLDPESARHPENYSIAGLKIGAAKLHPNSPKIVILTAAPGFEVKKSYKMTVRGVKDASRNKNALKEAEVVIQGRD